MTTEAQLPLYPFYGSKEWTDLHARVGNGHCFIQAKPDPDKVGVWYFMLYSFVLDDDGTLGSSAIWQEKDDGYHPWEKCQQAIDEAERLGLEIVAYRPPHWPLCGQQQPEDQRAGESK